MSSCHMASGVDSSMQSLQITGLLAGAFQLPYSSLALRTSPSLRVSYMGARSSTQGASGGDPTIATSTEQIDFKSLSESDWKKRLTEEQYYVARKKGTERAFTGQYWNTKTPGVYHCICCDAPLFDSKAKFDSGTGWPSYYEFIGENVKMERDWSIPFMPRTEVLCATCDAHLGHVFNDGPRPTGKRYCINSASIVLWPTKEK